MQDVWVTGTILAAVFLALGGSLLVPRLRTAAPRGRPRPPTPIDPRENRLARRMAQTVGCDVAEALTAIRREIWIAPDQTDETLLKRAVYHYRRDLPDAACSVYRDRAPG